jgi:hypothetical protein
MDDKKPPWIYNPKSRRYRLFNAILVIDLIAFAVGAGLAAIALYYLHDYMTTN